MLSMFVLSNRRVPRNIQLVFQVLEHIASKNGRSITLTVTALEAVAGEKQAETRFTTLQVIRNSFSGFSLCVAEPISANPCSLLNLSYHELDHT